MPTAIVTGATGITGNAIVQHLLLDPSYTKIYTLSRRQTGLNDPRIQHAKLDLQASTTEMAQALQGVAADYVFFSAYLARPDEGETARVNSTLLSNFIEALEATGAIKQLKRLILTCGFKHYGVHLGLPKQPLLESDPRLKNGVGGRDWPPNFYYAQQDILEKASRRGNWEWICTLPNDVIGYAKNNFMNEATALGLYCAASKALPGSKLIYPGNRTNYFAYNCWTSAETHARFCLWAATAPGAGNNIFNVTNGDTQSFQGLWPRLAARFGCTVPDDMFGPDGQRADTSCATETQLPNSHPICVQARELGIPEDDALSTQRPMLRLPVDPQKWAHRQDVQKAWEKVRDTYSLDQKAWDGATWDFLTFVLGREWGCVGNMSKARALGWSGYEDTWEAFERTFETLEREGILPPAEKLRSG